MCCDCGGRTVPEQKDSQTKMQTGTAILLLILAGWKLIEIIFWMVHGVFAFFRG